MKYPFPKVVLPLYSLINVFMKWLPTIMQLFSYFWETTQISSKFLKSSWKQLWKALKETTAKASCTKCNFRIYSQEIDKNRNLWLQQTNLPKYKTRHSYYPCWKQRVIFNVSHSKSLWVLTMPINIWHFIQKLPAVKTSENSNNYGTHLHWSFSN